MIFESDTQPLCRCCGKPIRKYVRNVYLVDKPMLARSGYSREVVGEARTRADCQKFTNGHVVSTTRSYRNRELIGHFGEWDGRSYVDEFFCTGGCAQAFGYYAAKRAAQLPMTKRYVEALAKRKVTA
jgi:hypothetical protein